MLIVCAIVCICVQLCAMPIVCNAYCVRCTAQQIASLCSLAAGCCCPRNILYRTHSLPTGRNNENILLYMFHSFLLLISLSGVSGSAAVQAKMTIWKRLTLKPLKFYLNYLG